VILSPKTLLFITQERIRQKLLLRVNDMLDTLKPMVTPMPTQLKVILRFQKKGWSTAVVENKKVVGIITDGDIRRMLNDRDTFTDLTAKTS
jgi:arabinose-5-phosphate isomerase